MLFLFRVTTPRCTFPPVEDHTLLRLCENPSSLQGLLLSLFPLNISCQAKSTRGTDDQGLGSLPSSQLWHHVAGAHLVSTRITGSKL